MLRLARSTNRPYCGPQSGGSLVVSNPTTRGQRNTLGYGSTCTGPGPNNGCSNPIIPPNGTVVATAAFVGGQLLDEEGLPITELEAPVNEEDFFRPTTD